MANDNYTNRTAGISIRQYVLTLLATMAFMPTYAQSYSNVKAEDSFVSPETGNYTVYRYRSEEAREADKHLMFEEIPIDGTVESFTKKLNSKGLQTEKEFTWKGNQILVTVEGNKDNSSTTSIQVSYYYPDNKVGKSRYQKAINEFENSFKRKSSIKCYQIETDENTYEVFEVYNNLYNKVGEIVFSYFEPIRLGGGYLISLHYSDNVNSLQTKSSEYPQIPEEWYDYSYLMNVNGSKCYLASTGNGLYVKYIRQGYENNRILTGKDKETILSVLALSNNDNRKRKLFSGYIEYANRGIDSRKNYFKLISNDLEDKTRLFVSELQKQQQSSKAIVQNAFLDMLRNAIFTKKEQEMFKGAGVSTEMQNQLIRSTISGSGGNGKVSCGDCGLMFSNNADLRSHQNAVHGH